MMTYRGSLSSVFELRAPGCYRMLYMWEQGLCAQSFPGKILS